MRKQQIPDSPTTVEMPQDADVAQKPAHLTVGDVDVAEWQPLGWLRHWEFWLAMGLATFLRLWAIGTTQFLDDQTGLYAMARESILHHAIPITGIPSSIGTLNPPLSIYILLPFAAVTANPFPAGLALVLWNIAGVALCYIFGLRYFGRRVAAVGTLLFATGGAVLYYSRFLWQQNYLPPLLVLWAFTLYMGAVRGKRRWLAGNVALLILAIQLHPTSVLLAPVTVVGILIAPRLPQWRAYVITAVVGVLLFVPTLLFEGTSRGFDLRKLAHYVLHGGRFSLDVFRILWGALDGPDSADLGPTMPYASPHRVYFFVTWAVVLVVLSGWVVLTARVFAPAIAIWREEPADAARGMARQVADRGFAIWRGMRANATWRARFLLWLWVTFPPFTMLHNSGRLFTHYLLVIYPALFLVGGFGIEWLLDRFPLRATHPSALSRRVLPAVALAVLAVAVVGEGARMVLYATSLATGNFVAYYSYGYPLDEMLTLDGELTTLQQRQGATATYVAIPASSRYGTPAQYLLATDRSDRVAYTSTCVVVPAPSAGTTLALSLAPVTLSPNEPVDALLAALPNAQVAARVPIGGSAPLTVYRIAGLTPALPDETAARGVAFLDGNGNGLRLDAVSTGTPGYLRLRWTIVGAPPSGPGSPYYRVQVNLPGATTATVPQDCVATHLHAGDTLFTWIPTPSPVTALPSAVGETLATGMWLKVGAGTQALNEFTVGPFRFLTDEMDGGPLRSLSLAAAR